MSIKETMEKSIKDTLIKGVFDLIDKDPINNIDKVFALVKRTIKDKESSERIDAVYNYYKNNPPTYEFIHKILKTVDKKCLKKFFTNFFANASWFGTPKRQKYLDDEDIKVPFVILMSPSMRCNLRCTGCYAGKYSKKDDIPFEEVDRIVGEARDLGVYFFIILGGEPFINSYMLDIYEKYNDVEFVPFTNGTLIDEKTADRIKSLGNVVPMFSLEGFEEQTDKRRGKGVFKKVMHGMDLFKERGIPFGVSSATSRLNMDAVTSDEFVDMIISKGALLQWFFIYMPVGINPDVNTMLTPDQRIELGRRVRRLRLQKTYFPIDFFNDAPYVGGCIAGKYYCHINSKEDLEPCIFAHFSSTNLKDKPLLEALNNPLFKELRSRQPYNKNLLLPCMMIDNTNEVREIVAKTGAKPTESSGENMISNPEFMKQLDELAANYKPKAEEAWKKDFNSTGNYGMSKG